jgi:DMSO reductase family type II enzyme heme b subunit
MQIKRVPNGEALADPNGAAWSEVAAETVELGGTPLEAQPNRHIRNSLKGKQWGACARVELRAAHDGERVYFRLEWADGTANREHVEGDFPDAAALLFPLDGAAPLETMGSAERPVNAWFWRPDIEAEPQNLRAEGLGSVRLAAGAGLEARSAHADGAWRVVLSRPLAANGATVKLAPGAATSLAVAVWEGGSGERAGIKAYSRAWRDLAVEA